MLKNLGCWTKLKAPKLSDLRFLLGLNIISTIFLISILIFHLTSSNPFCWLNSSNSVCTFLSMETISVAFVMWIKALSLRFSAVLYQSWKVPKILQNVRFGQTQFLKYPKTTKSFTRQCFLADKNLNHKAK